MVKSFQFDSDRRTLPTNQQVEILPIGDRVLLRNRLTRALVMSNEAGSEILQRVLSGEPVVEIATDLAEAPDDLALVLSMIEETLQTWSEAGLLDATPPEALSLSPPSHETIPYQSRFQVGDRAVLLECDDPNVFETINGLMSEYQSTEEGAAAATTRLRIAATGEEFGVFQDGTPLWRSGLSDEARFLALRAAIAHLAGGETVGAVLHAGLAVKDGYGLLFAGTTGRGKSTLTLSLVKEGWRFGGDDLIALDHDGANVVALPLGAHIKSDKMLQEAAHPGRTLDWSYRPGGLFWPDDRVSPATRIKVAGLIFPEFSENSPPDQVLVTPEDGLQTLMTTGSDAVGPRNSLRAITNLLNSVRAEKWTYPTTDNAFVLLAGFLGSLPDGMIATPRR